MNKWSKILIGLIIVFSLWLNWHVLSLPYWYDEANTIYYVSQEEASRMIEFVENDFSPPLYYYVMRGWTSWVGTTESVTALLSFMIAVLAVGAAYWSARKMFNGKVAGMVGSLFLCSPLFLVYSTETRMYSLVILFGFLSMGFMWLVVTSTRLDIFLNRDNLLF